MNNTEMNHALVLLMIGVDNSSWNSVTNGQSFNLKNLVTNSAYEWPSTQNNQYSSKECPTPSCFVPLEEKSERSLQTNDTRQAGKEQNISDGKKSFVKKKTNSKKKEGNTKSSKTNAYLLYVCYLHHIDISFVTFNSLFSLSKLRVLKL